MFIVMTKMCYLMTCINVFAPKFGRNYHKTPACYILFACSTFLLPVVSRTMFTPRCILPSLRPSGE